MNFNPQQQQQPQQQQLPTQSQVIYHNQPQQSQVIHSQHHQLPVSVQPQNIGQSQIYNSQINNTVVQQSQTQPVQYHSVANPNIIVSQAPQQQIQQQQFQQQQSQQLPIQSTYNPPASIQKSQIQQQPIIQPSPIQKKFSSEEDVQNIVAKLIYLYLMVESNNEKERQKFGERRDFFPEKAFNFLKNYEKILEKKKQEQLQQQQEQNFFDFSRHPQTEQYTFIDKFKSGHIYPQEIIAFLKQRGFKANEAEVNCVIENFNDDKSQPGLDYQGFLNMILPQSIPQMRVDILKRKMLFELENTDQNLKMPFQDILFEIFQLEVNLVRISEKQKIKLINELKWDPLQEFQKLDTENQGYLDYNSIDSAIRKIGKTFVPREYLFLLKRMNLKEGDDTINFMSFNELLSPNLPYFQNSGQDYGNVGKQPEAYSSCNKSMISSPSMSRYFNDNTRSQAKNTIIPDRESIQKKQNNLCFVDARGRIVEQPHPEMQNYLKRNPELQDVIANNKQLMGQQDDGKYLLLPETEYNHKPFDIKPLPVKKPVRPLQYGPDYTNYQNAQQKQMSQQPRNLEFEQYQNEQERQMIKTQKNLLLNNYNPNMQHQAAQNVPLLKDIHDAQYYQSSKMELIDPIQSRQQLPVDTIDQSAQDLTNSGKNRRQNNQNQVSAHFIDATNNYNQNMHQYNKDIRNAALEITRNVTNNQGSANASMMQPQMMNQTQQQSQILNQSGLNRSIFNKPQQYQGNMMGQQNTMQKSSYVNFTPQQPRN